MTMTCWQGIRPVSQVITFFQPINPRFTSKSIQSCKCSVVVMPDLWDSICALNAINDSIWPLSLNSGATNQYNAFGAIDPITPDNYLVTTPGELCALKIEAASLLTADGLKPVVFQKLVTSAEGTKIFNTEMETLMFSVSGDSKLSGVLDFQNKVGHLFIFSEAGYEVNGLTIKNVDKVTLIAANFFGYYLKGYVLNTELASLVDIYFKENLGNLIINGKNNLNTNIKLFGNYIECIGSINSQGLDVLIFPGIRINDGFNNKDCIISTDSFILEYELTDKVNLELKLSAKNAIIKALNGIDHNADIKVDGTLRIAGKKVGGSGLIKAKDLFIVTEGFASPNPEKITISNNFALVLKDSNGEYVGGWYSGKLASVGGITSFTGKYFGVTTSFNMGSLHIAVYGKDKIILSVMNIQGSLIIDAKNCELAISSITGSENIEIYAHTLTTDKSTSIMAGKALRLEIQTFYQKGFYGHFNGVNLLWLSSFEGINLYGKLSSNSEVDIKSSYLHFYSQALECLGKTTLRVENGVFMEPDSKIQSNTCLIENFAGGRTTKVWLKDAIIEIGRDGKIKANEILLQMVGLNLKEEFISKTYFGWHTLGQSISGGEYFYNRDIAAGMDPAKVTFISVDSMGFGHLDFYKTKNIGSTGAVINAGGTLELDTAKLTLDKSFIKTKHGTVFIGSDKANLYIVGQVIKDRAFYNTRCWYDGCARIIGDLLQKNGYPYNAGHFLYSNYIDQSVNKDNCISSGIEGSVAGNFGVIVSVCAGGMYNNLAIASPVSVAVSVPSGSTDLQVMQNYIANGIAILNQNNPVQLYGFVA